MSMRISIGAALVLAATLAQANEITSMYVDPVTARTGEEVTLTINGAGDYCGLRVGFGDGRDLDVKVDTSAGTFPKVITHIYERPGEYTLWVKGAKVTSHYPCDGSATVRLLVRGADLSGRSATRAALCPSGWTLLRDMPQADGSFACRPLNTNDRPPVRGFTCASGFRYWERPRVFGCKRVYR